MNGIPVISCGETHYRKRGFTLDPNTWDEYFSTLEKVLSDLPAHRLTEEQTAKAWNYAYRFFFEYPRPFPWRLMNFWDDLEVWSIERVLLGAATALFILNRLSWSACLFTEFWFWDESENIVVGGPAGPQNPALASPGQAWISQDYEYAQSDRTEGAHLQFVARPGRVTLLQLRGTPGGWQAMVATGEALDSPPRLEGYPHAAVRLDAPVDRFVRQAARVGSTQQWVMAYGEVLKEVIAFCELAGIPLEVIQ